MELAVVDNGKGFPEKWAASGSADADERITVLLKQVGTKKKVFSG